MLLGVAALTPQHTQAQCSGGAAFQSVTYSTTLTGPGTAAYPFTMPQFNPSPGGYTLVAAVFKSNVTTTNTMGLVNTNAFEADFTPQVYRSDNLKLSGSTVYGGGATYTGYPYTALDPSGAPGDHVTYGPGTIFNNTFIFADSIIDNATLTAKYQGSSSLNLLYSPTFYINNKPTGVNATPNFSDAINFSLTYYFCNPTVLATGIFDFTAEKTGDQTADLKWLNTNEEPGRQYIVEVSVNGQDFTPAGTVASDASSYQANYDFLYTIPATATGRLYFRIKQVEPDGKASWSDVRVINLDGANNQTFTIYPNPPTDYIYLSLPGNAQDWQVDIIAADGATVLRNVYRVTNNPRINFGRRLAAGAYFVRATSTRTAKHYSGSFLVR